MTKEQTNCGPIVLWYRASVDSKEFQRKNDEKGRNRIPDKRNLRNGSNQKEKKEEEKRRKLDKKGIKDIPSSCGKVEDTDPPACPEETRLIESPGEIYS